MICTGNNDEETAAGALPRPVLLELGLAGVRGAFHRPLPAGVRMRWRAPIERRRRLAKHELVEHSGEACEQ